MPFQTSAKNYDREFTSEGYVLIFYTINYALVDELEENSLYFHANWHRERVTKLQEDYKLIDRLKGQGYYVGTYLCAYLPRTLLVGRRRV